MMNQVILIKTNPQTTCTITLDVSLSLQFGYSGKTNWKHTCGSVQKHIQVHQEKFLQQQRGSATQKVELSSGLIWLKVFGL